MWYQTLLDSGRVPDLVIRAGIRRLLAARRLVGSQTPVVSLQFIVMRHNETQLQAAAQTARALGVDKYLVKTAQVYSPEEAGAYLPTDPAYSRYASAARGRLRVKGQPAAGCNVLWYSAMIDWDGTVTPCCFDKNAEFPLGNAFAGERLAAIWRGQAYSAFRRRVLADRQQVPMCTNCSEGYRGMFSHVEELGA